MTNGMRNLQIGLQNFKEIVKTEILNMGSLIELYGNVKVLEYRVTELRRIENEKSTGNWDYAPHDLVYEVQDLEREIREMIKAIK